MWTLIGGMRLAAPPGTAKFLFVKSRCQLCFSKSEKNKIDDDNFLTASRTGQACICGNMQLLKPACSHIHLVAPKLQQVWIYRCAICRQVGTPAKHQCAAPQKHFDLAEGLHDRQASFRQIFVRGRLLRQAAISLLGSVGAGVSRVSGRQALLQLRGRGCGLWDSNPRAPGRDQQRLCSSVVLLPPAQESWGRTEYA